MNRITLIKNAADWAATNGISNLKANHRDFELPRSFVSDDLENPIVPDVSGQSFEKECFVEVALKSHFLNHFVLKWKLLGRLAKIKGGKLYLLAPRGHRSFIKKILKKYQINGEIVMWKIPEY